MSNNEDRCALFSKRNINRENIDIKGWRFLILYKVQFKKKKGQRTSLSFIYKIEEWTKE